jgi:SMC interacting uncharacterized protein involved in chromosome segregation
MSDENSRFKRELEELRTIRDELRVKAHLGRLEAEEKWSEVEARWEDLEAKAKQIGRESGEALEDVRAAAKLLAGELHETYKGIKKRIFS